MQGKDVSSSRRRLARRIAATVCLLFLALIAAAWGVGTLLIAPANRHIGAPPRDLPTEDVTFSSESGAQLHGWFVRGKKGQGVVILLHGVHGSRRSMLGRARLLAGAGYSVLLFDFQSHGESTGKEITFGYLEGRDVFAAVQFVHQKAPGERVGLIGLSMGGAAALLSPAAKQVDALVLEMVYPTIEEAITDRISIWLGPVGGCLSPLFVLQISPRLGISPSQLHPIDCVNPLTTPKLFIVGADDQHTTLAESKHLFDRASTPKELWVVAGAHHMDLYAKAPAKYRQRVLPFLADHLKR